MEKGNVDMELIRRYIRGELTPREMYALERQAQADPMLMDIILGMEQEALDVHDDNLADIRKRIAARAGQQQTTTRRLAPIQRWAIAASILAVLTVGTWWFTREDTVVEQQREATVAATPREAPQAEVEVSPGPVSPIDATESDDTPKRARIASPEAAVADLTEKKEERLAMVTPKADTGMDPLDSVVVVGYGAQKKSTITGAVARIAAAEMDSPAIHKEQAFAGRADGIRIRGISTPREHVSHQPITGKVIDEATHEPLAGVTIQITDEQAVTTDKLGHFMAVGTPRTLTARYIGYETQTVRIDGRDSLTIALQPSEVGLSEVVVVGYHQRHNQTEAEHVRHTESSLAPRDGWDAYQQYIKDAVKLAHGQKGTVDLTFTVADDGRPTDITVVESTNKALNTFAKLIVRDGPRWTPGANNERKVTLRVEF